MNSPEETIIVKIPLNQGAEPPVVEFPVLQTIAKGKLIRVATPAMALQDLIAGDLSLADGTPCEVVLRYEIAKQRKDWVGHPYKAGVLSVLAPRDIEKGERLTFTSRFGGLDYVQGETYEKYSNEPSRPYFSGMSWVLHLEVSDDLESRSRIKVSPNAHFSFETGEPIKLEAFWKSDNTLNIRHFDYSSNPAPKTGPVEIIFPDGSSIERELVDDISNNKIDLAEQLPLGSRIAVSDVDGQKAISNAAPFTAKGERVCFGEFHWHTEISSDGKRPLRDALRTARDELCMDYAGPADHIGKEGHFTRGTPDTQVEALLEYDTPGEFAILPGAELSHRVGHANFYCDSVENYKQVCRNLLPSSKSYPYNENAEYGWNFLTDAIIPDHTFLVPHHTNTNSFDKEGVINKETGRPFWSAMTLPRGAEMPHLRLFEIYQGRGSFEDETPNDEWRILAGGYGVSVRSALMKGYRCGFTGGTDNHQGWPGRKHAGGMIDGYTAVLTDKVDTASIWGALYARRCYATTGARMICDVTLNDQPIGSELKLAWNAERKLKVNIYGTAPLEKIEIVSAGITIDSIPVDGKSWDIETEWEDLRPGRPLHDVYYYLRIRQKDGNIAWLSPFWIDTE